MIVVKDASVLIHLAKITLLEKSCGYFRKVMVPKMVYDEVMEGREKGFADAEIVATAVANKKVSLMEVKNKSLVEKANRFNVQSGEAEAVALYWQEKADFLATDDDNVRKKKQLLDLAVIGTPAILLKLRKHKLIDASKFNSSVYALRKIGWFSSAVTDKLLMEGK